MAEGCNGSRWADAREADRDRPGRPQGHPGRVPGQQAGDAGEAARHPGQLAGAGEIFRQATKVPRARRSEPAGGAAPAAMPGRPLTGRQPAETAQPARQIAPRQETPGQQERRSGIEDPAFREYVTARRRSLLRTAYLLTGNVADAEDLVQSALAKTYSAWDRIEDMGALDGYVRRAIVNTHISWWRGRRMEELPTDEIPDQAVADHAADSDLQHTMRQAVDRLPERMRAAVLLRYYEDMTEAEVAEVLGVSLGTVKSTVARAVAKLRVDAELHSE
jgi:RNA polymerase sigma-70 factor (sigma-E family)